MAYVDAILHIADLPAMMADLSQRAPERLDPETGAVLGLAHTPIARNGNAALTYVRVSEAEATQWRGSLGVTILAESTSGPGVAQALYAAIFADPVKRALYDAVWQRLPVAGPEGGETIPPEQFGVLM